jgi:hypothetical protein
VRLGLFLCGSSFVSRDICIGWQGEFGAVYAGVWNQPGGGKIKVAVKTLHRDSMGKVRVPSFLKIKNNFTK